jgi:hypothetical protein
MPRTYTHTVYISIGRNEVEAEVTYTVTPGFAGDAIDPPYSAQCDIRSVEVVLEGKPTVRVAAPEWLAAIIEADEDIHADMLSEADEDDGGYADDLRDQLRDDRLVGWL